MYSKRTTVINETGIHARPAGAFAQTAKKFDCDVTVKNVSSDKGTAVSAKSLIRIMSEELTKGSVIEISADGAGEREAVETLIALINSGFNE